MNLKRGPLFLILFLLFILIFILGVRYGQRVEKTNKAISFILSITPTKPPTPTLPLEFKSYENKTCGIRFLHPSTLILKEESTKSAVFTENNNLTLEFNCNKQNKVASSTSEVVFKQLVNPRNGQTISVSVKKSLYPLFEKSLEFF